MCSETFTNASLIIQCLALVDNECMGNLKRLTVHRETITDCETQHKMLDYPDHRDKNKPIDLFPIESYRN